MAGAYSTAFSTAFNFAPAADILGVVASADAAGVVGTVASVGIALVAGVIAGAPAAGIAGTVSAVVDTQERTITRGIATLVAGTGEVNTGIGLGATPGGR